MANIRPRLPTEIPLVRDNKLISQEWVKFIQSFLLQIPDPGKLTVQSTNPLTIDTPASTLFFTEEGKTFRDESIHYPPITGDVNNTTDKLVHNLKEITTAASLSLRKLANDAKGRVTSTELVTKDDLTPLLDTTYVNVTGDTMTGDLKVPSLTVANHSLIWDDTDKTLQLSLNDDVNLQIGQETLLLAYNRTGATIPNGKLIVVVGAHSSQPEIQLADNVNNWNGIIGMATEDVLNNSSGFITTFGVVHGLNTSSFSEGDSLFMGTSGSVTNVQPASPAAKMKIGYCVRSHPNQGMVFVSQAHHLSLSENSDVTFTSLATNNLLQYDGIKWVNIVPPYLPITSPTFNTGMTGDLLTLSSATTMKQKFIATSVTSMGYLNMDASSLFMSNNAWHNGAWQTDDTTKKKFAYLQHLGTGRHEFRSSAVGATVTWVNSLIMDETSASFAVPFGYGTGAGGTVTQLTSKATGVTLNKSSGAITMNNAALASGSVVSFTLTNSAITANDAIIVHRKSGGTAAAYMVWVDSVAAGSCVICVRNISVGSLSEAIVLTFNVMKGSTN